MFKIYMFHHLNNLIGTKKNIIYNGLISNPNTIISDNIENCDYIFP